jgi:hypothetical protein
MKNTCELVTYPKPLGSRCVPCAFMKVDVYANVNRAHFNIDVYANVNILEIDGISRFVDF